MQVNIYFHNQHMTYNKNILYLEAPGIKYILQIYKNHHPLISILKQGIIKITYIDKPNDVIKMTSGGVLYIKKKNLINIVII